MSPTQQLRTNNKPPKLITKSRFRSFVSSLRQRRSKSAHPDSLLLTLPLNIFLQSILPLLPLISKVCLALTCKRLYGILSPLLLPHPRLAWPRLLATRSYENPLNQPHHERNQLLLLLEDPARWMYCSACLKLHPPSRFRTYEIQDHFEPLDRTCESSQSCGVVDLCPCLALTFSDRIGLEKWLRTGTADTLLPDRVRRAFQRSVVDGGKAGLIHLCSKTDHADLFLSMDMIVTLDERDYLMRQTRYHIYFYIPWPVRRPGYEMEPIFVCPHNNVIPALSHPIRKAGFTCWCGASVSVVGDITEGFPIVVRCVKNFGGTDRQVVFNWYTSRRDYCCKLAGKWYLKHGQEFYSGM
ncbi:hypothetical protein BJX61DRAFT_539920 [Aspergillus egyptiacus]|nr:hypothetical protein BJX61DRAFT_539920 [Aspergillus egyptiacus]